MELGHKLCIHTMTNQRIKVAPECDSSFMQKKGIQDKRFFLKGS
jgi:hypothetical protein